MNSKGPRRSERWLARAPLAGVVLGAGLLAPGCAGKGLDGSTDTNTNWQLGAEPEVRPPPEPIAPELELTGPFKPAPRGLEMATPGNCVVTCEAVFSGGECSGTATLPTLGRTLSDWQGQQCSLGPVLEGRCRGGVRFAWRGGDAGEVRYFDPKGAFVGLSSFSGPNPSTCNGVRRWPDQVVCDEPSVTRELCPQALGPAAFRPRGDSLL